MRRYRYRCTICRTTSPVVLDPDDLDAEGDAHRQAVHGGHFPDDELAGEIDRLGRWYAALSPLARLHARIADHLSQASFTYRGLTWHFSATHACCHGPETASAASPQGTTVTSTPLRKSARYGARSTSSPDARMCSRSPWGRFSRSPFNVPNPAS